MYIPVIIYVTCQVLSYLLICYLHQSYLFYIYGVIVHHSFYVFDLRNLLLETEPNIFHLFVRKSCQNQDVRHCVCACRLRYYGCQFMCTRSPKFNGSYLSVHASIFKILYCKVFCKYLSMFSCSFPVVILNCITKKNL